MSRLLYLVASQIDGTLSPDAVADAASADLGRSLSTGQVRHLITGKLLPFGVVANPSATVVPPKANALLTLRARGTLVPEQAANAIGTLPFVRFDGYFIVGDLIGVPDLFTRTAGLRLRSRILVTGWTMCALGFLTLTIGYLLLRGRFGRRVLAVAAVLACVIALAGYWAMQGQFQGW
jgi:hypothetical protein